MQRNIIQPYKRRKSCHLWQHEWTLRVYAEWNKSDREIKIPYDFIYMWNLKKKKTLNSYIQRTDCLLPEVGVWRWWAGKHMKWVVKVQSSSYKTVSPGFVKESVYQITKYSLKACLISFWRGMRIPVFGNGPTYWTWNLLLSHISVHINGQVREGTHLWDYDVINTCTHIHTTHTPHTYTHTYT